ncbi:class I SAM-dependent methyltransferase [Sphingomonas lenta]|uniref:Methyltransferase domain-containing protein n=1 Tax=Sphingomonas lenta TaxID=1141887 RepID=A0A2A2SG77_9SPHN|nr:class I SAM-dependent methyltransferase [Sphingomonas lenta]PAX08212.1 hypothetical protein CKY28_11625 [Sphingomonas lenta]
MIGAVRARLAGRTAGEVAGLVAKNIAYGLRRLSPGAAAARRRSMAFDLRWGTDTTTLANLSELSVDRARARHGVRYQPSNGEALRWAVAAAGVEPAGCSFVDYGCGKGRIVMMASALGFARSVGVEFAPELCAVARANARRFVERGGAAHAPEIVEGDAGAYLPPAGPAFAYLYNPFGPVVLAEVVAKLEAHAASGAPVWVAYVDPRHPELFAAERWAIAARQDGAVLLRAR